MVKAIGKLTVATASNGNVGVYYQQYPHRTLFLGIVWQQCLFGRGHNVFIRTWALGPFVIGRTDTTVR